MWNKPWGYKDWFLTGAGLIVAGILLQLSFILTYLSSPRLLLVTSTNSPEWRASDEFGVPHDLPFAMELKSQSDWRVGTVSAVMNVYTESGLSFVRTFSAERPYFVEGCIVRLENSWVEDASAPLSSVFVVVPVKWYPLFLAGLSVLLLGLVSIAVTDFLKRRSS